MVAFRKWFPALAIVALLLGTAATASAQVTCSTTTGVPPLVRAEGYAELTGDIVLRCTGGVPTAAGADVPRVNFAIFLNTFITSRVLNSAGLSEAVLLMDEPSGTVVECGNTAGCDVDGTGTGVDYGSSASVPNLYRGTLVQQFAGTDTIQQEYLSFPGVPYDPAGTVERVIRITNIRANAARLGPGTIFAPSRIDASISITSPSSIAINNPIQTVAWINRGLGDFTLAEAPGNASPFFTCVGNPGLVDFDDDDVVFAGANVTTLARFTEGFNSAFKRISVGNPVVANVVATADGNAIATVPAGYTGDRPGIGLQNMAGQNLFTESGFVWGDEDGSGIADTGTRLLLRVGNVPEGVNVWVGLYEASAYASGGGVGTPTATRSRVRLVSLGGSEDGLLGAGNLDFAGIPGGTTGGPVGYARLTDDLMATYEVVGSDPFRIDVIDIPVVVTFDAEDQVVTDTAPTISGALAPADDPAVDEDPLDDMGIELASRGSIWPIPRFVDTEIQRNLFEVNPCRTDILFPWVVNRDGFDTGIAIANTSEDPFGTPGQTGNCTINYYGEPPTGSDEWEPQTTTSAIEPGRVLRFVVSTGGTNGIAGTPGFLGYVIAQCDFQYAHGFAFVTDGPIGQARVAEGYLGLILNRGDNAGGSEQLDN
jgi:hypothetical protein